MEILDLFWGPIVSTIQDRTQAMHTLHTSAVTMMNKKVNLTEVLPCSRQLLISYPCAAKWLQSILSEASSVPEAPDSLTPGK